MLPSMRYYLSFIDCDSTFDQYGFKKKASPSTSTAISRHVQSIMWILRQALEDVGGWYRYGLGCLLKLTYTGRCSFHTEPSKLWGMWVYERTSIMVLSSKFWRSSTDTDFIASGGPNHYTWNVIRSEADELLFRHAAKSGAKAFDGVKVNSIEFAQPPTSNGTAGNESGASALGRPVSASYTLKSEGVSGAVKFDYIIDASGSKGLLSTKYLKNRTFNQGLKNVASWGYWRSTGKYGIGTAREDSPYFEALIGMSTLQLCTRQKIVLRCN